MTNRAVLTVVAILLVGAFAPGCGGRKQPATDDAGRTSVRIGLNWTAEVEHGGFYAASVGGDYEAERLAVEIVEGGPGAPVLKQVADGAFDFGVSTADDVLLARASDMPIVAVMAPLQISPRCIMVHASTGIERLEDLKNVTLCANDAKPFFAFLQKHAPLTGVEVVPYGGNIARFLLDKNVAQQGYVFSEPFDARQQGADPRVFKLADIGFNPYSSVLVTNEATIRDRPELVKAFVAASVRGWQSYLKEPKPANARIHEVNDQMSLDVLAFGAEELRPLSQGEDAALGFGAMTLERWQTLVTQLEEIELLKPGAVAPQDAFTTRFLLVETAAGAAKPPKST